VPLPTIRAVRSRRQAAGIALAALAAALLPGQASAASPEQRLVERYAPVIRVVTQVEPCGHGEPFVPIDIRRVLDNEDVALRGPWDRSSLAKIGPSADDLRGKYEYHLDFPGDPLDPGCSYEQWEKRMTRGSRATVYGRVVTERGKPGKLAVQYWFFYVFNDFNNKHEGDWEMIQLDFDARNAETALQRRPEEVGYSQHEGAERARWGDSKLQLVGTHPVVYPAAGSHANYFGTALYLGRSSAQGVGCDDTEGPSRQLRSRVAFVPTSRSAYLAEYPWLDYQGRWGELQPAFYNGPTGPNLKRQWTEPISWAEDSWRDDSFAVPAGTALGPSVTSFFCGGVAAGSSLLTRIIRNPVPALVVLGALAALLLWALSRTEWEPSTPLRMRRRRRWGQILSASAHLYRARFALFAGIGLLFVAIALIESGVQWLLFQVATVAPLVHSAGEANGFVVGLAVALGLPFTLIALTLVQAAVARSMAEIDESRAIGPRAALAGAFARFVPLFWALVKVAVVVVVLDLTVVGIPLSAWLLVRWSLFTQVIVLEGQPARGSLRRSARLVRGHWLRAASVSVVSAGIGLLVGPLVGVLLLFVTSASFNVVNLVAGIVYAATLPFVAIATTYLYYDLLVRERLEAREVGAAAVLPAEA
jgi:hypothetical protein